MTKRILALFLVCILAVPLLVVPASANELADSTWINLLDYGSVNADGNFFTVLGAKTISLPVPVETHLYYIDAVVKSTQLITVTAIWGSRSSPLTVEQIGTSSNYRVYGELPFVNYTTLQLQFYSASTSYCTFLRCNVTAADTLRYPEITSIYATPSSSGTVTMSSPTSQAKCVLTYGSSDATRYVKSYIAMINLANWVEYDFVDVYFTANTYTLDSIQVFMGASGATSIPFEISYLNESTSGEADVNPSDTTTLNYLPVQRSVAIRCDLRGLERNSGEDAFVRIMGTYYSGQTSNFVGVDAYTGFVDVNNVNPVTYFLRNLWNTVEIGFSNVSTWISNQSSELGSILITGFNNISTWISEQTNAFLSLGEGDADDFNNQTATDATEWSEALDEIEKATMPDTDDLDIDLEHQIDGYDAEIGDLIKVFFQNEYIYVVFLLAFTFALISFTVFGKR